ncbi:MAG: hypothetical protein NTW94_02590 [Legionellales bacterium]|nr:hypothetical protein [Legionellales bacterium]
MSTSAPADRGKTAPTAVGGGGRVPMDPPAPRPTATPGATIATTPKSSLDDEKARFLLLFQNAEVIKDLTLIQLEALNLELTIKNNNNKTIDEATVRAIIQLIKSSVSLVNKTAADIQTSIQKDLDINLALAIAFNLKEPGLIAPTKENNRYDFEPYCKTQLTNFVTSLDEKYPPLAGVFGTKYSEDLEKILPEQRAGILSILKSIGLVNLDRAPIRHAIEHAEDFSKLSKEICDVFNTMNAKGISINGLRHEVMNMATADTTGKSLINLNALLTNLEKPSNIGKNDLTTIIGGLKDKTIEEAATLGKCLAPMHGVGGLLEYELKDLLALNHQQASYMASTLESMKEHPDFEKNKQRIFPQLIAIIGERDYTAEDLKNRAIFTGQILKAMKRNVRITDKTGDLTDNFISLLQLKTAVLKRLAPLVEHFQGDKNADRICSCLSKYMSVRETKDDQVFDKEVKECIKLMQENNIPLVQDLTKDKLGRLLLLPQAQLESATRIMKALADSNNLKKDPKAGFNEIMKSVNATPFEPDKAKLLAEVITKLGNTLTEKYPPRSNRSDLLKLNVGELKALNTKLETTGRTSAFSEKEIATAIKYAKANPTKRDETEPAPPGEGIELLPLRGGKIGPPLASPPRTLLVGAKLKRD